MTVVTKTDIRDFIEGQTRQISLSWISNDALYRSFCQWASFRVVNRISFQAFSRFLGHTLKIPTVRRWVAGRQIYGRRLWPLEKIRKSLNFGVDFI